MSVELLRRAAADMRALAEAATPGPWWAAVGKGPVRRKQQVALVGRADMRGQGEKGCIAVLAGVNGRRADDAEHIASWQPEVALAVAGWLEFVADGREALDTVAAHHGEPLGGGSVLFRDNEAKALAVAAAYLGENA